MSTSLAIRYGSPRTPASPYAFTAAELLQGAARALLYVNLAVPGVVVLVGTAISIVRGQLDGLGLGVVIVLFYTPMFVVPTSLVAILAAGLPLGWLVGTALRSVRRAALHVLAFAGLGAVVGFLATLVFDVTVFGGGSSSGWAWDPALLLFATAMGAVTAVCCALAWWRTTRSAQRRDAELARGNGPVPARQLPSVEVE